MPTDLPSAAPKDDDDGPSDPATVLVLLLCFVVTALLCIGVHAGWLSYDVDDVETPPAQGSGPLIDGVASSRVVTGSPGRGDGPDRAHPG